ncbi:MAG: hypothetical protein HYV62_06705, partial [Candidatus Rokubacteria bacterium]|nr:hypothetical protein [Candidatus Rokubacteria bacterium]
MEIQSDRVRFVLNPFHVRPVPPVLLPPEPSDVAAFHRSLPGYAPTPLVAL